jgi:hypothetical protein
MERHIYVLLFNKITSFPPSEGKFLEELGILPKSEKLSKSFLSQIGKNKLKS